MTDHMNDIDKSTKAGQAERTPPLTALYNKAGEVGEAFAGVGKAAIHGAIAGGIIMFAMGRGNMRVAFYSAVIGAAIGAGRQIYNNIKGASPAP